MSNPLFQMLGNANNNNNLLQQFYQFRNQFKGDPKQQVQELLNSGKVSQAEYDKAVQLANQMQSLLRM